MSRFLSRQSRSVLHTGDIEGARKYGRRSMLFSCLAMLLGVAVIIFIVFTIGMEEELKTNTHVVLYKVVQLHLSFSASLRAPAVNCGMEGVTSTVSF